MRRQRVQCFLHHETGRVHKGSSGVKGFVHDHCIGEDVSVELTFDDLEGVQRRFGVVFHNTFGHIGGGIECQRCADGVLLESTKKLGSRPECVQRFAASRLGGFLTVAGVWLGGLGGRRVGLGRGGHRQ